MQCYFITFIGINMVSPFDGCSTWINAMLEDVILFLVFGHPINLGSLA